MFSSQEATPEAISQSGLVHRVYLPEPELRHPATAVVLVHGRAGDAKVPWTFTRVLADPSPRNLRPVVVAPQAPHPDSPPSVPTSGFSWWLIDDHANIATTRSAAEAPRPATTREQLLPALESLERFVETLPALYGVRLGEIVLIGFSQGAAMVGTLSLLKPEWFRGVGLLAGFIPKLVYEEGWSKFTAEFTPAAAAKLPSYFISHGRSDRVVPYDRAEKAAHVLSNLGADVTFHLEDVGHKLGTAGMKALGAWFHELTSGSYGQREGDQAESGNEGGEESDGCGDRE